MDLFRAIHTDRASMINSPDQPGRLHVMSEWVSLLREHGLETIEAWLSSDRVSIWRDIRERQNGTIALNGRRFHVKRLRPPYGPLVRDEVTGIALLEQAGVRTVPLTAWGYDRHGNGVLVTRDLTGYVPADRQIREGVPFDDLLEPTADIAARLHGAGLHHRDLYLCHFLQSDSGEIRLIDAARVRRLPWLMRRRWIVKDLAQFRYSGQQVGVSEDQLDMWLERWAAQMETAGSRWHRAVTRKAAWIARHDQRLARRQPERRTSLE